MPGGRQFPMDSWLIDKFQRLMRTDRPPRKLFLVNIGYVSCSPGWEVGVHYEKRPGSDVRISSRQSYEGLDFEIVLKFFLSFSTS